MKSMGTLLIGLSLFMVLPIQAAKKTKKADEMTQTQEERPKETSTFLKCFATPQGFFYATIALAAAANSVIKGYAAYYYTFVEPIENLQRRRMYTTNQLAEALIMGYITRLALNDVKTSCT